MEVVETAEDGKTAIEDDETTVGDRETVMVDRQTVIGGRETVIGDHEPAIGDHETVIGDRETVIGCRETGIGDRETAIGDRESSIGDREPVSIGDRETANGDRETVSVGDRETFANNDKATSNVGGTVADIDAGVVFGGLETLDVSEGAVGVAETAEQTNSGDHAGTPPAEQQGQGGGERGGSDPSLTAMTLPVERGGKGVRAVIGVAVTAMYYAMWAAITLALG